MVAVRPVTPNKNVVLAEYIPDAFVERDVFRNATRDANRHLGEPGEDARILAERPQIGPILLARATLGWNVGGRKGVDDNLVPEPAAKPPGSPL